MLLLVEIWPKPDVVYELGNVSVSACAGKASSIGAAGVRPKYVAVPSKATQAALSNRSLMDSMASRVVIHRTYLTPSKGLRPVLRYVGGPRLPTAIYFDPSLACALRSARDNP